MKKDILSENALKIAKSRYFIDDEETWEELALRVARVAASVENGARSVYTNNFAEMITDMDFLPGGRILRNVGRPRGSLFNCLSKDTEVISETRGLVKITDLDVNERILNGVGKFDTVKTVINNGFKEKLLEIIVEGFGKNNKILCTEDHRFLVFSFKEGFVWKKAIEISDRDFMVTPKVAFDDNVDSVNVADVVDIKELYSIFSIKSINSVEYNDYVYDISMTDETNPHFTIVGAVSHNCYVLPCGDSIEEIGQYIKDSLILWSEGGGVGVNISHLRPRGAIIRGKGGNSSGPVSFLEAANAVSKTIESGGSRRAAALAGMHVSHPDILEFIDAKLVHGKLDHFNLSVAIDDKFLEAVETDGEWQFKFAQQNYGKIQAKVIWDKIIENMVSCAEPGLLHWGNLTSNNSYYFDPILCFTGDTLISTTDGLIPIKDLVDKKVNTVSDLRVIGSQGTFIEDGVGFKSGVKEVFEVKLENNQSIKLTANHKVWTKDGWKQVKDLKIKEDYMYVQNSISQHFVGNIDNEDEFDKGYLLGLLVGDGWITCRKDDEKIQYGFCFNESETDMMNFVEEKTNKIADGRKINWRRSSGGSKSFELASASTDVNKYFKQWGYTSRINKNGYVSGTRKSSKFISDEVLSETPSFKRGFISGLYTSDGSIQRVGKGSTGKNGKKITFTTSRKHIAERLQIMLNEFGIPSSVGSRISKLNGKLFTGYTVNISRTLACQAFKELIGCRHSEKNKNLEGYRFGSRWNEKYYGMFKVKSIESLGEQEVYDVETSTTHSLIANGIIVHNSTNPCVVGDTLIAVADGRNYVPIKQLADEGKDVPVYSLNESSGKVEVKMMRNPRKTGFNKKIFKITLDDGSYFKCNEHHKIYMKDASIKTASELVPGDRLNHMVKFNASFEEVFNHSNSKSQDYCWINNGYGKTVAEHRLIAEFSKGTPLESDDVVHHVDYNGLNNSFDNLKVMKRKDHGRLHSKNMLGKNNPMNRFPEKNWLIKQDWSGEKNGRYKGISPASIFNIAVKLSKKLGRRVTREEWNNYCKENNLPYSKYSISGYKSFSKFLKSAAKKASVFVTENSVMTREYKRYLDLLEETDLDIYFDNGIMVNKTCEHCGNKFSVRWQRREQCFCSVTCSNVGRNPNDISREGFLSRQEVTRFKQLKIFNELRDKLNRDPWKIEWENKCKELSVPFRLMGQAYNIKKNPHVFRTYGELKEAANGKNYKVVSVEVCGYEDVYNGTVDNNHNFYIMTNETTTKSGKVKYNHILNRQCGEAPLSSYGICDLGSLVLPNFITGNINTNWRKLEKTIKLSVRLLDNIIDVNKYVLKNVEIKAHNARRIGLGVMGLAEYLFAKKLRYGSKKAIYEIERLMRFIRDTAYEASVELSIEKGTFPKFDASQYGKAHFIRSLPAALRMQIKKHGVRNVTLMAMAPTGCQDKDTMIVTDKGIFTLEEIGDINGEKWQNIDLKVSQEKFQEERSATKFYINGKANTKKIYLKSGNTLESTYNHQYRVLENGKYIWKRADELNIGDDIISVLETYNKQTDPTLEMPITTHWNQNNINTISSMNEKLAEFLGIYFGDGSNHHKGIRIHCNSKNEEDYLYVAKLGKEVFGITPTFYDNGRNCMAVCFNSNLILKFLELNGLLKQKSNEISIPKILRSSSKNSLKAFIKGYIFADGSKTGNTFFIDTASKKMSKELLIIIRALGNDVRIQKHISGLGSEIFRVFIKKGVYKFRPSSEQDKKRQLESLNLNNCVVDEIIKIENSENYTYDIEVPDTVTYIANSVVSHNTISLLPEVSSGIEPLFRKAYRRSDRVSDRIYVHPLYEKFLKETDGSIEEWFVDTDDLTPSDHFETQVAVQKFTDGAVSKTINMPSDTTTEDLSTLTMEYIYDLKGVTVYVDGSREGQILNKISEEDVRAYLKSGNMDNSADEETTKCATGSCEI